MHARQLISTIAVVGATFAFGFEPAAQAATLSYSRTASGITGSGAITALIVPGSDFYGNTFTSPTSLISGSPSPGFGFYDDYLFTIAGASANSITSTLNLGDMLAIDNLQVRLYDTSGNPSLPVLDTPVGSVINAWSSAVTYAP